MGAWSLAWGRAVTMQSTPLTGAPGHRSRSGSSDWRRGSPSSRRSGPVGRSTSTAVTTHSAARARIRGRSSSRPPPLLIGGDGEVRLLRIVAMHADEWNSHAPGPDVYRAKRARLEEHCRAVGRDPNTIHRSWMGGILIGRDRSEVLEKGRWFHSFLGPPAGGSPAAVPEVLRQRHWLVGTPDEVAE